MRLNEFLKILEQIAASKGLSRPFIVGGMPRDKLLNRLDKVEDLDICTGDNTIHQLAKEVMAALPKDANAHYKTLSDGHAQITIGPIKLDFSSNYRAPGVEPLLKRAGLKDPSQMQLELYSRDFTCNALLLSTDLQTIKDPIGLGITDINRKMLRTCLPARITLRVDNKRIIRILYLAAKLGFDVDPEIIDWVKKNPQLIANVKPKYLSGRLKKACDADINKTVKLLDEMGLWKYVPIIPELMQHSRGKI